MNRRILPIAVLALSGALGHGVLAEDLRLPDRAPAPTPRPQVPAPDTKPEPAPPAVAPIPGQPMSDAERSCRTALRTLAAAFEERPPESGDGGCVVAHPVLLTSLSAGVEIEPDALLKCSMAEAAARFVRETIAPAARKHLRADLETLRQASGYVCRPRNGSSKLSEHAFGNALDISAFVLADGRVIEVGAPGDEAARRFLKEIRNAACGPFKTVLGPGSDADHADHFHFDLAPRRNGTFCQ